MRPVSGHGLMSSGQDDVFQRRTVDIHNRHGAGRMAVLDFGPQDRPVDLVFAHANGFNAHTYRQLLTPLASQWRIWAPDLRGHGRTTLPTHTARRRNWHDHRDDLVALVEATGSPSVALCGHSIGGVSSLLAAARVPQRVKSLLLLDPVIWPRLTASAFRMPGLDRLPSRSPIVKSTLRRRAIFDSREQAFASWQGRGAFKGWPDETLHDYLTDGLLETPEGYCLACSPAWEASNYASQAHNPWRALRRYRGPVHIMRAQKGSLCAVNSPSAGHSLTVETVAGTGHLFPLTHSETVRAALVRQLQGTAVSARAD